MLTLAQLMVLRDYVIYCRYEAQRKAREAEEFDNPAVKNEQNRRERELKRLEMALGAEIDAFIEGSEIVCPEPTASLKPRATAPRAKRKNNAIGKKSKKRGDGTTGTSSSAKNANASSGKRKRGRPPKHAPKG